MTCHGKLYPSAYSAARMPWHVMAYGMSCHGIRHDMPLHMPWHAKAQAGAWRGIHMRWHGYVTCTSRIHIVCSVSRHFVSSQVGNAAAASSAAANAFFIIHYAEEEAAPAAAGIRAKSVSHATSWSRDVWTVKLIVQASSWFRLAGAVKLIIHVTSWFRIADSTVKLIIHATSWFRIDATSWFRIADWTVKLIIHASPWFRPAVGSTISSRSCSTISSRSSICSWFGVALALCS